MRNKYKIILIVSCLFLSCCAGFLLYEHGSAYSYKEINEPYICDNNFTTMSAYLKLKYIDERDVYLGEILYNIKDKRCRYTICSQPEIRSGDYIQTRWDFEVDEKNGVINSIEISDNRQMGILKNINITHDTRNKVLEDYKYQKKAGKSFVTIESPDNTTVFIWGGNPSRHEKYR